jgi:gluconolactonase
MRNFIFTPVFCLIFVCCSCNDNKMEKTVTALTADSAAVFGKIEIYDSSAAGMIDSNASIEKIGSNYTWSEGPLWIPAKQMLLFTDVPENKIYQWHMKDTPVLYLMPSGYTGSVKRIGGEDGANGLALDKEGRLLMCQSGNRQVVRLNTAIDTPQPNFTVLTARYNGKRYNSPNDLVADSKGNIFFTDPIYGLPQRENDSTRELRFEGVYKINAAGKTSLLIDSIRRPNGIALSADEKILYVCSSDEVHPRWFAYQLDANQNIKAGGILLDGTDMMEKASVKQGADGFKIDKSGNIFAAGPDGISIISPAGRRLALIKIYKRRTSNCAFNEAKDVLYITADDVLLRIRLHS